MTYQDGKKPDTMLNTLKQIIKKKLLYAKPSGPYNFLINKLQMGMDVDLAESVVSSGYFSEVLEPQPIDLDKLKKILVIAPHQDDEAIGCGGLLSKLSEMGAEITLVFVTDGRPIGTDADEVVKIRSQESNKAAKLLNAKIIELGINNVSMEAEVSDLKRMAEICNEGWSGIFTPWVLDRPYKHRLVNYFLSKAMQGLDQNAQVYCYQVHSPLIPNVFFDYTALKEQKQKLIGLYQSQLKGQNYSHLSLGQDAWNGRYLPPSKEATYIECYTQLPVKAYRKLVTVYDQNPGQAFHNNEDCLKSWQSIKNMQF